MSFFQMLGRLVTEPVVLFFDAVCSLLTRYSFNPGLAVLALSLIVCLIATPLRPRSIAEWKKDKKRTAVLLFLQACSLAASIQWFTGVKAFRGVSFGPIRDLGGAGALLLFGGGYTVFALIRRFTGLGYKPMELNPRQRKTDRNNRILLVFCMLYMALLTGLLIPSELIKASPAEFVDAHYYRNPARYLLSSSLIAAGTYLLWGTVYGFLLSPKARKHYTLLTAILAAASAVDYMFFGGDYGFISSALQYETIISNHTGRVLLNAGCVLLTAGAVYLIRKKWPLVLRIICLYGCAALAVMSVININSLETGAQQVRELSAKITDEKPSFRMDRKGKNVVVIMLDRAISGFVPFFLNEKPELKEQFDGFTWYPNARSYGYHTNIAAPALFGGYEYTPDGMEQRPGMTLMEKHNEALKVMPVSFLRSGYEVTVCDAPYANYQWIPDLSIYDEYPGIQTWNTIGSFDEYKVQMLANLDRNRNRNLYFYSVFRAAPLVFQEMLYDRGRYLEMDAGLNDGEGSELIGVSPDFLNSYMVMKNLGTMTEVTEDGTDTFLMLTNEMTHDIAELQEPDYVPRSEADNDAYEAEHGIRRTDDGRELNPAECDDLARTHYQSDMAAFILLGQWFEELKREGLYDNTRIIIVSDHGCYLGLFGLDLRERNPEAASLGYNPDEWSDTMCYNPLLMAKDFGASGFRTDHTFMTNADTPFLAFDGLIEDPVNPFTGRPMTQDAKQEPEQHVIESDWHVVLNNGAGFSNPLRISLKGQDIFKAENWSVGR